MLYTIIIKLPTFKVLVNVISDELNEISIRVQPLRNPSRTHKCIDIDQPHAILITDYSRLIHLNGQIKSISVELKPKCGFVFTPSATCRFCMHQHYKHFLDPTCVVSAYCPLDLFSRSPSRIKLALKALCAVPGNNLRVHVDGNVVDIEKGMYAIESTFGAGLVEICQAVILNERILEEILALQQLDKLGIQTIHEMRENCSVDDESISEFIEAATYKDCSVMISLGNSGSEASALLTVLDVGDMQISYHCVSLDIDPKSLTKVPSYYKLDCAITDHYKTLGINKKCA